MRNRRLSFLRRRNLRECAVFIQNGIRLLDRRGNLIRTAREDQETVDAEDTGEKRDTTTDPSALQNRLHEDPDISESLQQ